MNWIKLYYLLTLLVFTVAASGQQQVGLGLDDFLLVKMAKKTYGEESVEKYNGTPYRNASFVNGDVYINKGRYSGLAMRFDVFNDYIEFKKDNQVYILDPDLKIQKVTIGAEVFVVQEFPFKGKNKVGYLSLLDSGKAVLMAKHVIAYREAQAPKALESQGTPAQYTAMPDVFYIKIGNGKLKEIESLKKMIEEFPDKENELSEFAKKEKISVRKKDELIKLIKYYNALQ